MKKAGVAGYFGRGYYALYRNFLIPREQSAAEAAFLIDTLKPRKGERWLDLPCGYGRHLAELARLRPDLELIGGDLNLRYLREPQLNRLARLVCCDMRRLPFASRSFRVVLNLLNSFGYHEGKGDRRFIAEAARVLRPGGCLVLDLPDRRGLLKLVRTHPRIRYCADDYEVTENFEWDPTRQQLANWTRWVWPGGAELAKYRLRLYTPAQIEQLLGREGFAVQSWFGDFSGASFVPGKSNRMMLICRKA